MTIRTAAIPNQRCQAGLTLLELMLAMGLLAVGMAMVATLFPTALAQTQESDAQSMGMIIAENAAAVCQTRLHASSLPAPGQPLALVLPDRSSGGTWLTPPDMTYPVESELKSTDPGYDPNAVQKIPAYRWLLFGRQLDDVGTVQLVIVPFRTYGKSEDEIYDLSQTPPVLKDTVVHVYRADGCTLSGRQLTIPAGEAKLNYGAPVIVMDDAGPGPAGAPKAGQYAYIVGEDRANSVATLSNSLNGDGTYNVWIVGAPSGAAYERSDSPALGVLVVRTSLQP